MATVWDKDKHTARKQLEDYETDARIILYMCGGLNYTKKNGGVWRLDWVSVTELYTALHKIEHKKELEFEDKVLERQIRRAIERLVPTSKDRFSGTLLLAPKKLESKSSNQKLRRHFKLSEDVTRIVNVFLFLRNKKNYWREFVKTPYYKKFVEEQTLASIQEAFGFMYGIDYERTKVLLETYDFKLSKEDWNRYIEDMFHAYCNNSPAFVKFVLNEHKNLKNLVKLISEYTSDAVAIFQTVTLCLLMKDYLDGVIGHKNDYVFGSNEYIFNSLLKKHMEALQQHNFQEMQSIKERYKKQQKRRE